MAAVGLAALGAGGLVAAGTLDEGGSRAAGEVPSPTTGATTQTVPTTQPPTTTTTLPPSTTKTLRLVRTVTGGLAPKSVVASGTGLVFAQNMMYRHTVTVYDATGNLVKTIPDAVDLAAFGIAGHPGVSRGAPVEAAFSPFGSYAYVSNYSMYGTGFGPEGSDSCSPSSGYDDSTAYRISLSTLAIDQVIPVGAVPKYVAVTPNGRYLLVSNWCSFDLTIYDTYAEREAARIDLGPTPRGIVVDPTSKTAYVAVMGTRDVAVVDLTTLTLSGWIRGVGSGPRHLVIDPAGAFLYVTLNGEGRVAKVDLSTRSVVAKVATGSAPRSMAISPDGHSLYVVNYESANMTKVATADLRVLQTVSTNAHPIGITYEPTAGRVWVACYSGSIQVFEEA